MSPLCLADTCHSSLGGAGTAQPDGAPAPTVGIEFIAVPMLDEYVSRVEQRPDGALSEEDIRELCTGINAPELVKPLMELKLRQLRLVNKVKK